MSLTGIAKPHDEEEDRLNALIARGPLYVGFSFDLGANPEAGTTTELGAVGCPNYTREQVDWSGISANSPTSSQIINTNDLSWVLEPPGPFGFGGYNITTVGLYDAPTGGNLVRYIYVGTVLEPLRLLGDTVAGHFAVRVQILAGHLTVIED